MNTPSMTTATDPAAFELPEPGYPMLTHVISNALFPDMQAEAVVCQQCQVSLAVPTDKGIWVVDRPHPLVPELKIERMFLDHGGVEIYSMSENRKICARNFIPMDWIRIIEEEMPLEVFFEELSGTVKPDAPMLTRIISNAFYETQRSNVTCPNCKAAVSAPVPSSDPVAWIVGQQHPRALSGDASMKVMRILFDQGGVEVFSMSGDGKTGIRNFIPMSGIRLTEEVMPPAMFLKELEKVEADVGDDGEPDDPEDPDDAEPAPPNGQETAPS
jgi:hypothetical protein